MMERGTERNERKGQTAKRRNRGMPALAHSPIRPFAVSGLREGFSLIETVVATLILSGAVVTLGAISTNVLRDSRLNQHYETAAGIIERQFTTIDAVGIDQFVEQDQLEGFYDQAEPGYHWRVQTQYKGVDDLYAVMITVEWMEGRRPYRLVAQTRLDGTNGTKTQQPSNPASAPTAEPGGPS